MSNPAQDYSPGMEYRLTCESRRGALLVIRDWIRDQESIKRAFIQCYFRRNPPRKLRIEAREVSGATLVPVELEQDPHVGYQ